jgi:hypothetical protein
MCALAAAGGGVAEAAITLAPTPSWISTDDDYATGGMLWDVDADGWLDLVVGNGNDMASEYDAVFYNRRGQLELEAGWRSRDDGFDGHLDLGDVDGDGDLDVVITGFLQPFQEQLYRNDDGRLTPEPVWVNEELDNSFSCALGDVDGDGDLDLATISGYFDPAPVRLYRNNGGTLERRASWFTPRVYNCNDVAWCDVDGDGDLDLLAAGHGEPCYLFVNRGGTLETTPSWQSTLATEFNQVAFGDVDGDGWRDLAVSDNSGNRVLLYENRGGTLARTPAWEAPIRYASCVKLVDVDADGDLDLAAGGWWAPIQVFENRRGALGAAPAWSYYPGNGALVCEQVTFGDVDNDGLTFVLSEAYDGDGSQKLWYLEHAPLHALARVTVDGRPLEPTEYCYHPEEAWVSLARAPQPGNGNVAFSYVYSSDLELAVTNWDEPSGNFLFDNTAGGAVAVTAFGVVPAAQGLEIKWTVTRGTPEGFNIYRRRLDRGGYEWPLERVNEALIVGNGPTFAYVDGEAAGGATYDYWLEAVLESGGVATFGPRRGWVRRAAFALGQSYPNPAATVTTIPFSLATASTFRVDLYDLAGRHIRTLAEGHTAARGARSFEVDVSALPPGVYIYRLTTPAGEAARKLVVAP